MSSFHHHFDDTIKFIDFHISSIENGNFVFIEFPLLRSELIFSGPNILMEFNSGYQIPPFEYNGFSASLTFIEGTTTTLPPPTPTFDHDSHHHEPPHDVATPPPKFTACDQVEIIIIMYFLCSILLFISYVLCDILILPSQFDYSS